MQLPRTGIVLVLLLAACSASRSSNDVAETRLILDSLLVVHTQNFKARNIDGIMAAYTDNPIVYSNHVAPVRGRAALRAFITQLVQADLDSLEYHTQELSVYGDSALQIMTYGFGMRAPGTGAPIAGQGSGFALWVRGHDGKWRIHRDILNSSDPIQASSH